MSHKFNKESTIARCPLKLIVAPQQEILKSSPKKKKKTLNLLGEYRVQ